MVDSGEAAIAVGWSYIDDLESSVSSVNAALDAVNSKSVDMARAHFGNSIASRVRLLNETTLDAAFAGNRLLASLSADDRAMLEPEMEIAEFAGGDTVTWEVTPIVGGLFGAARGVVPGV